MDASLARGHARAAINAMPDISALLNRLDGRKKPTQAVLSMMPKRLPRTPKTSVLFGAQRAHVHPSTTCFLAQWTPGVRLVVGLTVARAQHLPLLSRDGAAAIDDVEALVLLRSEASVLFFDGSFHPEPYALEQNFTTAVCASLSRHALQRMLQRGGTTPERLAHDTRRALVLADLVQRHAQITAQVSFAKGGTFLLPWKDGAFVASATRVRPWEDGRTLPHLAIRTYLDAAKLRPRDLARLAPLRAIVEGHPLQTLASYHSGLADPAPKGPSKDAWQAALAANQDRQEYRPSGADPSATAIAEPLEAVSFDRSGAIGIVGRIEAAAARLPALSGSA